jgi:hypothetical protein
VRRQETLCFQRRHASLAGRGDGLTIDVVGHVAGGEYARNRCRGRTWLGLDVAPVFRLQLSSKQVRCRRMADGDEDPIDVTLRCDPGSSYSSTARQ